MSTQTLTLVVATALLVAVGGWLFLSSGDISDIAPPQTFTSDPVEVAPEAESEPLQPQAPADETPQAPATD